MSENIPHTVMRVNKDRYNAYHGDYTPDGMLGRLRVLKGTLVETLLDESLNKNGLDLEVAGNNLDNNQFTEGEIKELADLLGSLIQSLDTNDESTAAEIATTIAGLVKNVVERPPQ